MIERIEIISQECDKEQAKMYFEDAVHQLHTTST
jgi:hypothetical protein